MATETFDTPGAGTWTVPANVYSVSVLLIGGGAGGGGGAVATDGGGGGGGGAATIIQLAVTPAAMISLFVGDGGAAGTAGNNGTAGEDTWFSASGTALAKGGSPGLVGGAGGAGGAAASGIGDTKYNGGDGFDPAAADGGGGGGGAGSTGDGGDSSGLSGGTGTSPGGNGGAGGSLSPGNAGSTYGGGGGGGSVNEAGGAGVKGEIVLTYFEFTTDQHPISQLNTFRNRNAPPTGRAELSAIDQWQTINDFVTTLPNPQIMFPREPNAPYSGKESVSNYPYDGTDPTDPYLVAGFPQKDFPDRGKPLPARGRAHEQQPWFEVIPWPQLFGADTASVFPATVPPRSAPIAGRARFVFLDPSAQFDILPPGHVLDQQGAAPQRLSLDRSRTIALDGHQITLEAVEDYYASWALPGQPPPAVAPRGGLAALDLGSREWTLDALTFGWDAVQRRPAVSLPTGRTESLWVVADPAQIADPLWFAQQLPPVRAVVTRQSGMRTDPLYAYYTVIATGPFWVVTGQVSPAAGAVAGEPLGMGD